MASEKQIAANRLNAQKSSGPRSAAGKARARRNAIRHGLAVNFGKDPLAANAIETMTKLLLQSGQSEQAARLVAAAEYATNAVNAVRSKTAETLLDAAENELGGSSFKAALARLQRIERYEKKAILQKKRALSYIQPKDAPIYRTNPIFLNENKTGSA
jgi:hypothetical protein